MLIYICFEIVMDWRLVHFRTNDDVRVSYPLRPLQRSCDVIAGLVDLTNLSDDFHVPLTSIQLDRALELLETKTYLGSIPAMIDGLYGAEYLGMHLTSTELTQMLLAIQLKNVEQYETILKDTEYGTKLTVHTLLMLLELRDELESLPYKGAMERCDDALKHFKKIETPSSADITDLFVALLPLHMRIQFEPIVRELRTIDSKFIVTETQKPVLLNTLAPFCKYMTISMQCRYGGLCEEDKNKMLDEASDHLTEIIKVGTDAYLSGQIQLGLGPVGQLGLVGQMGPVAQMRVVQMEDDGNNSDGDEAGEIVQIITRFDPHPKNGRFDPEYDE
jgi:hypothetical protein